MSDVYAPPFGLTGTLLEKNLEPGTQEWLDAGVSSSRVSAIMGQSTYSNWFKVWHQMAGNLPIEDVATDVQRRGHLLEPAILQWFFEEHPEMRRVDTPGANTWLSADNSGHISNPDALALATGESVARIVEAKSVARDEASEWGAPGTDEIPDYYRTQCQWHMYCTGAMFCHVPILGGYLGFDEYLVRRDQSEIDELAAVVNEFLDTLPGKPNFQLPNLDGHTATYETVKKLHPSIEEGAVEIPYDVAARFASSIANFAEAERAKSYAYAEVADLIGPFKSAVYTPKDDKSIKVAYRKSGKRGTHLQAASKLVIPRPVTPIDQGKHETAS